MKGKTQPPLGLDMGFDEALRRFIQTNPRELAENVATSKGKRGPPGQSPPSKMVDKQPK